MTWCKNCYMDTSTRTESSPPDKVKVCVRCSSVRERIKEPELKIVCPFCRAPYTAEMEDSLWASQGCDTCGPEIDGDITIKCSNCKKTVYKKEF